MKQPAKRGAPALAWTRKEQRKNERIAKKVRKAEHYAKIHAKPAKNAKAVHTEKNRHMGPSEERSKSASLALKAAARKEQPEKSLKKEARLGLDDDPIMRAAEEALSNGMESDGFKDQFDSGSEGEGYLGAAESEADTDSDSDSDTKMSRSATAVQAYSAKAQLPQALPPKSTRVAPAKRFASTSHNDSPKAEEDASTIRLKKQIKGQLNRLNAANLESIVIAIEGIYRLHPRNAVTTILLELVLDAITHMANLLDSFAMVFAALVSMLANIMGVDVAAHVLQHTIADLELQYSAAELVGEEGEAAQRAAINIIVFLAYLYDLRVISHIIICDIIGRSIERLSELDVEIILKLVRSTGAQLRRDNPTALKDIIIALGQRASLIPASDQSSRFKFMLETILDLKNNKRKLAEAQHVELEPIKKLLRNLVHSRSIATFEPLGIGLKDLGEAGSRGKWWLVGGTWNPEAPSKAVASDKSIPEDAARQSADILKLAQTQHMNTDIRRAIFSVLMTSEDYVDAFERLSALKLKATQEREIARVLLHSMCQERVYNPFYALVAKQFCSLRHNFKITFQYCFWDAIKEIERYDLRKSTHIAKFYGYLLSEGAVPLASLKTAPFERLCEKEIVFFQLLVGMFFQSASDDTFLQSVKKLAENDAMAELRSGFGFFLNTFLTHTAVAANPLIGDSNREKIGQRVQLAKSILTRA